MKLEARWRAFAAVARQRSFSAAAAELRISQPAISSHIAELERTLGLKLVERARRDGALTSAGDFVANYVLRAESLLAQADLGAAQFRTSSSGSVAVAASSLTGTYLLPEIISDFQHSNPGVRVGLQLGTALQAVELLRSHRAELGFVAGMVAAPEIETEPLLEYEVVIVAKAALVPRRLSRDSLERITTPASKSHAPHRAADASMLPSHQYPHSITSSARARRVGGIVTPSALTVLRLMISSNLVG
jgi:DNA-binding transcriptional LysR family regulator